MSICFRIEFWNPQYTDYRHIKQKPKRKKKHR